MRNDPEKLYKKLRREFQDAVNDKKLPDEFRFGDLRICLNVYREKGKQPQPRVCVRRDGDPDWCHIAETAGGAASFVIGLLYGRDAIDNPLSEPSEPDCGADFTLAEAIIQAGFK